MSLNFHFKNANFYKILHLVTSNYNFPDIPLENAQPTTVSYQTSWGRMLASVLGDTEEVHTFPLLYAASPIFKIANIKIVRDGDTF